MYQELFDYLNQEFGILPLESQMQEIERIILKSNNSSGLNETRAVRQNEQTKEVCSHHRWFKGKIRITNETYCLICGHRSAN